MEKGNVSKLTLLDKAPLSFEKNVGQIDDEAKYLVRGNGYMALFTKRGVVLTVIQPKNGEMPKKEDRLAKSKDDLKKEKIKNEKKIDYDTSVVTLAFEGTNANFEIIGEKEQKSKANYFRGKESGKWIKNVTIHEKVIYKEIYPGIDVVFYGTPKQLEHDFIVKPGADLNKINLSVQGADNIEVDNEGNLIIKVKAAELKLQKPSAFQEINGIKKEVESAFNLKDNKIGFKVGNYDKSAELNIDPILYYSKLFWGYGPQYGEAIAADDSGYAYVTGYIYSYYSGNDEVIVIKLDPYGNVVYFTYLSGSNDDYGWGIAADKFGQAYITGATHSGDFPSIGGYQPNLNGYENAFVTKLDANGLIVYSTYLGGNYYDYGYGIAVDASGNAYVVGEAESANFPKTAAAYQSSFNGNGMAFITKLNASGTGLVYSTYLGGSNYEYGSGIRVDNLGYAYVIGTTYSNDFPIIFGAYQSKFIGGPEVFVTKLNQYGSDLVYSTYLGGSNSDYGNAIALDNNGYVYVTGVTYSKDFPITPGVYQTILNGYADAFITKLNQNGSGLIYSTYLGGGSYDVGYGIAVDDLGNVWVTGATESSDFPITPDAFQSYFGGFEDGFITKLNNDASLVLYSTFIGDYYYNVGYGIAVDKLGNSYGTGYDTDYWSWPVAYVVKLAVEANLSIEKLAAPDPVLAGGELNYTIKVINNGPDAAFVVGMTDTLPSNVDFVLALFSKGTINYSSGVVTWNIGSLEVGEVAIITIKVKASVVGTISNTATVTINGIAQNYITINSNVVDVYQQISDINNTVNDIEDKLDGTKDSLILQMKDQLDDIEAKIDSLPCALGTKLTTGPVVRDSAARTLIVSINNSTSDPVSVVVTVVNYASTPGVNNTFTVTIPANSIKTTSLQNPPAQYEVIFDGMISGVYGWTSTTSINGYWNFNSNSLIASNTFRHAELVNKE